MTKPASQEAELFVGAGALEAPRAEALPADAPEAVSAIEPHILLINALGSLRRASQLNGYVDISLRDLAPGDQAAVKRIETVKEKRGKQTADAQKTFKEALELLGAQGVTEEDLQTLGIKSFSAFVTNYYGAHKHKANVSFARLIRQEAERRVQQPDVTVSQVNRGHRLRPHQPLTKEKDKELEKLDKRAKLEIVPSDPRAGYLPSTHREKGRVGIFLDYLDNPDYVFGVNNQLKEVFLKVKRENDGDDEKGMRAVESIAWELCDYLQDAIRARQQLMSMREEVLDIHPDVKVADDELASHPGMVDIVSYLNRLEWLETGQVRGLNRDPLRSTEDRWAHEGEGRHKRVHSPYTSPNRTEAFEKYIAKKLKTLTFGEVKAVIDEVIDNEQHRAIFMARRMRDMEVYSEYPEAVQAAIDEGFASLAEAAGLQLTANGHMGEVA